MLQLDYSEFYITNLCNFNCKGCNRFNNYAFAGNYRWKDYQGIYQQWAQVIDLERWAIMGGEPMTNPDYIEWMIGVCDLWPNSIGEFVTNGYFLTAQHQEFYQAIKNTQGRVTLSISLHNNSRTNPMLSTVLQWLTAPVKITRTPENIEEIPGINVTWSQAYNNIKDESWPNCASPGDWHNLSDKIRYECEHQHKFSPEIIANQSRWWSLIDSNGVKVLIKPENFFHQSAVIETSTGFKLHFSDALTAHEVCDSKHCHHFVAGKLYKCGPVALLPEFDRQFGLNLSPEDRILLQGYQPGEVNEELATFIANIDNVIDQCRFCPESFDNKEIFAQHGNKLKFYRRNDRT